MKPDEGTAFPCVYCGEWIKYKDFPNSNYAQCRSCLDASIKRDRKSLITFVVIVLGAVGTVVCCYLLY